LNEYRSRESRGSVISYLFQRRREEGRKEERERDVEKREEERKGASETRASDAGDTAGRVACQVTVSV